MIQKRVKVLDAHRYRKLVAQNFEVKCMSQDPRTIIEGIHDFRARAIEYVAWNSNIPLERLLVMLDQAYLRVSYTAINNMILDGLDAVALAAIRPGTDPEREELAHSEPIEIKCEVYDQVAANLEISSVDLDDALYGLSCARRIIDNAYWRMRGILPMGPRVNAHEAIMVAFKEVTGFDAMGEAEKLISDLEFEQEMDAKRGKMIAENYQLPLLFELFFARLAKKINVSPREAAGLLYRIHEICSDSERTTSPQRFNQDLSFLGESLQNVHIKHALIVLDLIMSTHPPVFMTHSLQEEMPIDEEADRAQLEKMGKLLFGPLDGD